MHPDIWISSIPVRPGVEVTGRVSVTMSFLHKDSIGGHYMIHDDHVTLSIMRSGAKAAMRFRTAEFARVFEACLREVLALESPAETPVRAGATKSATPPPRIGERDRAPALSQNA
jgi:hypothetical protein